MATKPVQLVAFALVILLVPGGARSRETGNWPKNPDQLHVSLQVLHALADGPVVCRVVLTNVSAVPLDYATDMFSEGPFCTVKGRWKAKKKALLEIQSVIGNPGPYRNHLEPGESRSATFFLHRDHLAIPPGLCSVHFGWEVYRESKDRKLSLLFVCQRTEQIEIRPAVKKNLTQVLQELERKFAQIAPAAQRDDKYEWSNYDASQFLATALADSRHKEFVPLIIKAIDSLGAAGFKRQLIRTVYESYPTPRGGFAAIADYLSTQQPASAGDLFEYWKAHDKAHEESAKRQTDLTKAPNPHKPGVDESGDEFMRKLTLSQEEAWRNSRRHLDTRLTSEDFARLRVIPNVWVRALLYSYYPNRCPAPWRETLLNDLKKSLQEPSAVRKLVTLLENSQYAVRERATQELSRLGPLWVPLFRELAKKSSSPEAARRLRMIADTLDDPVPFRLYQRTVRHLISDQSPQNKAMLQILLDAPTPNKVPQAARAAVAERDRREK